MRELESLLHIRVGELTGEPGIGTGSAIPGFKEDW